MLVLWPKSKEKQRNERSLKKLLFCTEVGCSEVFYDQDEYEKHIAEGSHTSAADKTSMDKVRRSFTSRMKVSSQIYMSDGGHEAADIDIQSACNNRCATMNIFQHVGWALPIRSTFRYSLKQKIVLYEYFMKGEENGKKMSADQVAKLSRNKLGTFEYLKEADQVTFLSLVKIVS